VRGQPEGLHLMATRKPWTEPELAMLREHFPNRQTTVLAAELGRDYGSVCAQAYRMGLKKTEAFYADQGLSGRLVGQRGATTRFKPGIVPWNTGTKGLSGQHANTKASQFKPGHKPQTWKPVGSYRVVPDGVLEQKVCEAKGANHMRWKPVHRMVWEAAHGPVPAGHIVAFKPGMRTNLLEEITVDRLECITRRENMLRNSVHSKYPPELAKLVQLRGALVRAIRAKEEEANPGNTTQPQGKTA
jgi:hypothetical protein